MKATERAKLIKDIAAELRVINGMAISALPDDAAHNLIIARNHLRAITIKLRNGD